MTTYYVDKDNGSDSYTGLSWGQAFKTLTEAQDKAGTGDTVYVRAGATPYYEQLIIASENQRWLADTGHQPIIDGKYHDQLANRNVFESPTNAYVVTRRRYDQYPSIVKLAAVGAVLDGFYIRNVAGGGIQMGKANCIVRNCKVDYTYDEPLSINGGTGRKTCTDLLVEDCEFTRGGVHIFAAADNKLAYQQEAADGKENPSDLGYQVCVSMKNCVRGTFRRIIVRHNFGEGIVLGKLAEECVVENSISYNNHHVNCYINNSSRSIVRFCFLCNTDNPEMRRKGKWASEPLIVSEEIAGQNDTPSDFASEHKIYGNILVGGRQTLGITRDSPKNAAKLRRVYFGYNTIIALSGITQFALAGGPPDTGSHESSVFENNVIYCPADVTLWKNANIPGLRGRGNIVYRPGGIGGTLPAYIDGPGTMVVDPRLVSPTFKLVDTNTNIKGQYATFTLGTALNNYKLTSTSPAKNAAQTDSSFNGLTVPTLATQKDYFGVGRTQPDSGAHEFGGSETNSVTAAFEANPSATTLVEGTQVTFTNQSYPTGTANITGYAWEVKKGGTTVHTATTADLAYTFATDGSYTVKLTTTATGGLSDNETVAYTITNPGGGVVVTAGFSRIPTQTTFPQGTIVQMQDVSTIQNGTFGSRLFEVLALPGLTVVGQSTNSVFLHTFNTVGSFRMKLTHTAATGQSDTEQVDVVVTSVTAPTVTADFTASDPDLTIGEGNSITFTNTSTVANTTISGYIWTVERTGGGGQTIYTTTNIAHVFTQAGTYIVRLLANTAAGVSDSHDETVTVQSDTVAGMAFMVVPVSFAVNTGTGAQTVTAAALGTMVPKGVQVRMTNATASGTAANGALWCEGAADGISQWVHTRWSKDATSDSVTRRRRRNGALVMSIDDAGAKTGEAVFVKFVPGGMEINVTDGFPAGYLAEAIFYAGDDCRFWAGSVTVGNKDVAVEVATGFQPDVVFLASTWAPDEDTAATRAYLTRGWAAREGGQWCISNEDRHAQATSAVYGRLTSRVATSTEGDGLEYGGTCHVDAAGWSQSGFTLTARNASLHRVAGVVAFATGGLGVQLTAEALSTSSPSSHALPFEAQTVLGLTTTATATGLLSGAAAVGIGSYGWSSHGSYSRSLSIASANGAATSSTRGLSATGFRAVNHDGTNLWNGTVAADTDSADITWTAAPAYGYKVVFLALEPGDVVEIGDDPIANFQAEFDYGDGRNGRVAVWFDSSLSNGRGNEITGYLWDFGDGTTSTEAHPLKIYETAGAYTVSLTVTTSAGSSTKAVESFVTYEDAVETDVLVGLSLPATSGGDTPNAVDEETLDHTHTVAGRWINLEALDADGVAEFVAQEPDAVYARAAYDLVNHRWVIQEPDGAIRYGATTP